MQVQMEGDRGGGRGEPHFKITLITSFHILNKLIQLYFIQK